MQRMKVVRDYDEALYVLYQALLICEGQLFIVVETLRVWKYENIRIVTVKTVSVIQK